MYFPPHQLFSVLCFYFRLERSLQPADVQPLQRLRGERRLRLLRVLLLHRGLRPRVRLRRRAVRQRVQAEEGCMPAGDGDRRRGEGTVQ